MTVNGVNFITAICPLELYFQYMFVIFLEGQLYSATIADLNARDALIYRQPMRTEQHDSQWLNGSYSHDILKLHRVVSDKENNVLPYISNVLRP